MKRWHKREGEKSWQRFTAEDAESSNQGKPGGHAGGSSRTDTAVVVVDACREEVVDRAARCQFE